MNSLHRFLKKLSILLIVFSVIGSGIYLLTRPKQNHCFNNRQDSGETGVDCGGFCEKACPLAPKPEGVQDIRINWAKAVEDGRNNYDFVASIANDNESWGAASANYTFKYYDESGNKLGEKSGTTYLMPKGTGKDADPVKYLIQENVSSNTRPARVELVLSDLKWDNVTSLSDIDNLNSGIIRISGKYFSMNKPLNTYASGGTTKNASIYDFKQVDLSVVLFDKNGQLMAAGTTNQNTMVSGDGWGFVVLFPNFKGAESDIARIDCRAETNVFNSLNFIKEYRGKASL